MEHQQMENEQTDNVQTPVGWRSSRKKKTTERLTYAQSMELQEGRDTDAVQELFVEHNLDNKNPLTIMQTILDEQDTLYLHEARKQPDWDKFKMAMNEEISQHIKNKNFVIIQKKNDMKNIDELPAVWALRRKRKMPDGSVTKYKSRLNIDGSRQIKGVHYQESWAPVATWSTIRLMNTWAIINNWKTIHIDFVQAFPQAPIEREINI